jgi:putative sigma-54 modulation protein
MMMRLTALFLLLSSTAAFTSVLPGRHASALRMSSTTDLPIILNGQNIELTPALVEHVNKRIGNTLSKLANHGAIRECDVVLSVNKNPKVKTRCVCAWIDAISLAASAVRFSTHILNFITLRLLLFQVKNGHRVEIITNLKGTTIICKNESPDMYASIDSAAHALNRKLQKYKERRTEGWHGGGHMGDDLAAALDSLDDLDVGVEEAESIAVDEGFVDLDKPGVVKVKSFQLDKPISLEEAVFALDYVDHDFYVFKNEANDKISVVYKRHTGGVGLVEP